ncbi:MAG TPA: SIS domain-containing protein [Thermoleophilaceae bacterium]|nr:SIS domain-containing protein [Thermoleophilaceae bacterium]
MRRTMERQPKDLRALLAAPTPAEAAAARIERCPRVFLSGTGTSWHAANHGAFMLREAGVEAWAVEASQAVLHGPRPEREDALILLSHRGTKRHAGTLSEDARARGVTVVAIGGVGAPGADIETVAQEESAAYTASHLGALMRLAQVAAALGADLGDLDAVPDAVAAALAEAGAGVEPPERLLQFTGEGPNRWTSAEGALKVRETAAVAADGLSAEQLLHGPVAALGPRDGLVALDGGGPGAARVAEVAAAAERSGVPVCTFRATALGEALSVFPLTAAVQRIALETAELLGTDPDAFGYDRPERKAAFEGIAL